MKRRTSILMAWLVLFASCSPPAKATGSAGKGSPAEPHKLELAAFKTAIAAAALPKDVAEAVETKAAGSPDRFFALLGQVAGRRRADPMLFARADKEVALPSAYAPTDLEALAGTNLKLRASAAKAFREMAAAASAKGVKLVASSTYRSHEYQAKVFARNVAESGEAEAARFSARPGRSQHQLGTAIDFGSITDAFADTAAGKWLYANAGAFGFSLSFPRGMESVTGYVWECWHYRFIGREAMSLQDEFFGGVQHYLLKFLAVWPDLQVDPPGA